MENFSQIDFTFINFLKQAEEEKLQKEKEERSKQFLPFPENERSETSISNRVRKSLKDFWFFDKTYFPKELYGEYFEPNRMLKSIVKLSEIPGFHLVLGPRKHGKTVLAKKLMIWKLLTNRSKVAGIYAETLTKSSAILKDIFTLIFTNEYIMHDWKANFSEANSNQVAFKIDLPLEFSELNKTSRFCAAFSEGRSVRGYIRLFGRPEFIIGDDIETLESSFTPASVNLRNDKLMEAFHSLSDNGIFLSLGNDFNNSSFMHKFRLDAEQGLLHKNYTVQVFKAWQHNQPLWHQRWKAKTENELRSIIAPKSESDWQGNYQQNPIPPEGFFFLQQHYIEYSSLPNDLRAVIYCDPNLSKKGKGDTTAITTLAYSPKTNIYYILNSICRSFSDANLLLDTLLKLKNETKNVYAIGFDGNVAQESTWTQFVRNWCVINKSAFPVIEYKSYRVNDLAKNVQLVYSENRIQFPVNFAKSQDGENYLSQIFAFTGQKKGSLDDAPDSLICAFEFLHERKLARNSFQPIKTIKDYYSIM
jgi:hypothetical protein